MKALVTGGAGFIGSHVVDRCLAAGHDVAVVDDLSSGRREFVNPRARLYAVDIRSPEVTEVFETERPEVMFHLAAQAEVRRSVADPLFDVQVNVAGSVNLLEHCRKLGVTRVIYSSTGGAVYGDTTVLPTPEGHPTRPASPYGTSKLAVEHYLTCWETLYGIRPIALRYANVYGPRQNPLGEAGVVAIFSHRILRGEPAVINGDGEQTRDYVYVEDVARANLLALDHPNVTGALNVGTEIETSVNDLFKRLVTAAGVSAESRNAPPKAGEQRRSVLDPGAAKRLLGWVHQVSLDEGLRRTVEYFRRNPQ